MSYASGGIVPEGKRVLIGMGQDGGAEAVIPLTREPVVSPGFAELLRLREFVSDLATAGVRFDLNPTVDMSAGAAPYTHYLARIDKSIRERAAAALSPDLETPNA